MNYPNNYRETTHSFSILNITSPPVAIPRWAALLKLGGFGGTFMRYALSMIHGYCFGYCVYVLAVKPAFITPFGDGKSWEIMGHWRFGTEFSCPNSFFRVLGESG